MKKFLSLVLALVMTMSLVTVSAGAKEFKDDTDVTYDEAVAVISEVGVVDGYTDGSFKPSDTLTRGAAAKIICNLILGPTTAAELRADTAPYKDVPVSNTFSGYIAYCAKEGIISGYADGSFRPAGTLTGYAFMKMLLGALGYDSENEGYTGANWSINVAKQAIGIGLNKGLVDEFNGVDFVTREEAALYAFNTLKATMVDYEQKITTTINGIDVVISQGNEKPVTWSEGRNNDGNIKKDGFVQFAEEFFPDLVRENDTDAFGRPANTWISNKKNVGTYMNYDLLVAEYTTKVEGGDVYSDIGSNATEYTLSYVQDGKAMTKNAAKDEAKKIAKKNDDKMGETGNGVLTQIFVDNAEEELTITEINTYLAETDDYNEKKETLSFNDIYGYGPSVKDVELDDIDTIKDYQDGDMVLVTIAEDEVQTIVPVETIKGVEIDEFSKKDYVKADGEAYKYAVTGKLNGSLGYSLLDDYDKDNLDDVTFNLYLDQYGYLIGLEEVEDKTEYVFITGYEQPYSYLTSKTADANAILEDGTRQTIKVDVKNSKLDNEATREVEAWTDGNAVHNTWYTFTEKDGVYKLDFAENQFRDTTGHEKDEDVAKTIDSKHLSQKAIAHADASKKDTFYYANADTIFVTVSVDTIKVGANDNKVVIDDVESVSTGVKNVSLDVYTDKKVKEEAKAGSGVNADSQGVYSVYKGGYVKVSIVIGDDGETTSRYAYMFGEPERERYSKAEDAYYWDMNVVMDGKETTVTFKTDLPAKDTFAEGLYKLSYKGEYASDAKLLVAENGTGKDLGWLYSYAQDPDAAKAVTGMGTSSDPLDLKADGETLWITEQNLERGFALATDCPAVIVEQKQNKNGDWVADDIVEYSSVAKAIRALDTYDNKNDNAKFDGQIYILFKDGIATSVILTDTVNKSNNTNPGVGSDKYEVVAVDTATKTLYLNKEDNVGELNDTEVVKAAQKALYEMGWELTSNKLDRGTTPFSVKAVNMNTANPAVFNWYIEWEK